MGEATFELHEPLSSASHQRLSFTTNFHEGNDIPAFLAGHQVHRLALQPFRNRLRELQHISLHGSSIGLSRVLAATTLRDFMSQLVPDPKQLLLEANNARVWHTVLYNTCRPHPHELTAPLRKVLDRGAEVASIWDLKMLVQRKTSKDPQWYMNLYMCAIHYLLYLMLETYIRYMPWRGPDGGNNDQETFNAAFHCFLEVSMEVYEMSLALPNVWRWPKWTPARKLERHINIRLAHTLLQARRYARNSDWMMALALGYHVAKRVVELTPGPVSELSWWRWMGPFEAWRTQGVQDRIFCIINDEEMRRRGVVRWTGRHPGLLLLTPSE
ncbi:hypothetical protein DHEL01_v209366 [Diaporthe helianthi]|uniref:Uncharacterized protein n=1 Tax=Diaporthe helianthi TaxID=158607 RepID=A0A2P5HPQ4_DIAHE|nr:hypothetical protein DHEL01_v209366 [Diaporthe helianthi]